jgi:hypothetical protein
MGMGWEEYFFFSANLYYAIVFETIPQPAIEVPLSSKMPSVKKKVKKNKK